MALLLRNVLYHPSFCFIPFLVLGVVLWLTASPGVGGFRTQHSVTAGGLILLFVYYSAIVLGSLVGFTAGRKLSRPARPSESAEKAFFYLVSAIGLFATVYTWYSLVRAGFNIRSAIEDSGMNTAKQLAYESYSYMFTLRYCNELSGSLSIYYLVSGRWRSLPIRLLCVVDLFCVLLVSAISFRMLLVQTVFCGMGLLVYSKYASVIPWRRVLLVMLLGLVVLGALTMSRNAAFYRQRFGVTNPVRALQIQVTRYLAAPVQVSLGVAEYAISDSSRFRRHEWNVVLLPTFLHPADKKSDDNSGGVGNQWYLSLVDIDPNLTTNSSFVRLYQLIGLFCIPFMFVMCACSSLVIGACVESESIVLKLMGVVILYLHVELWRVYQFHAGYVVFNLVICIVGLMLAL